MPKPLIDDKLWAIIEPLLPRRRARRKRYSRINRRREAGLVRSRGEAEGAVGDSPTLLSASIASAIPTLPARSRLHL